MEEPLSTDKPFTTNEQVASHAEREIAHQQDRQADASDDLLRTVHNTMAAGGTLNPGTDARNVVDTATKEIMDTVQVIDEKVGQYYSASGGDPGAPYSGGTTNDGGTGSDCIK